MNSSKTQEEVLEREDIEEKVNFTLAENAAVVWEWFCTVHELRY